MRNQAAQDVRENEIPLREKAEAARRRVHEAALEQMRTDKLRLEIQLAEAGAAAQPVRPEKVKAKLPIPKLPKFDENSDSMDDYLQRFERFQTILAVDKPHNGHSN